MVGQSEYSFNPETTYVSIFAYDYYCERRRPCLNSSSSSTLNAENLFGSTPCSPSIWMLARENPHCGKSGVPFINKTTGVNATALSIAALVCVERRRHCEGVSHVSCDLEMAAERGRSSRGAWHKACRIVSTLSKTMIYTFLQRIVMLLKSLHEEFLRITLIVIFGACSMPCAMTSAPSSGLEVIRGTKE